MHIIQIKPLLTPGLLKVHNMLLPLRVELPFPIAHFAVRAHIEEVAAAPDPVHGERFGAAADVDEAQVAAVGHGVIFFDKGELVGVAGDGEEEEEEGKEHDCFVLGSVRGVVVGTGSGGTALLFLW